MHLQTKFLYAKQNKNFFLVCIMPYTLFTLLVLKRKKLTINAVFILNEGTDVLCSKVMDDTEFHLCGSEYMTQTLLIFPQ